MTRLGDWLLAVAKGELDARKLSQRLSARGPVPREQLLDEAAELDQLHADGRVDGELHAELKAVIASLLVDLNRAPTQSDDPDATVFSDQTETVASDPGGGVDFEIEEEIDEADTRTRPAAEDDATDLVDQDLPELDFEIDEPAPDEPGADTHTDDEDGQTKVRDPSFGVDEEQTAHNPRGVLGDPDSTAFVSPGEVGAGAEDSESTAFFPGLRGDDVPASDATSGNRSGRRRAPVDVVQSLNSDDESSVSSRSQSRTGSRTGTGTGTGKSTMERRSWVRLSKEEGPTQVVDVGSRLKDRFVLERKIGEGGMGVVFLALDERKVEARDRNPRVAVKILNDAFRKHPDSLIALQRESRRSQQLAHDNIVRVYDFDKDGTVVFMTMEYVEGQDLRQLIRGLGGAGLSPEEAFPIIKGMALALDRAHSQGVVHSDFKPGNVMMTSDRVPKVFDFGIARAGKKVGEASGEQTVFDAGSLGALTPTYASYEMLEGSDPEPPDDLYALGCVAYELLTGSHPYNKKNAKVALTTGLKPAPVPSLTKRQWRTLKKCIAIKREDRTQTALELIEGLRPRTFAEKSLPIVTTGLGVLLLAGLAVWGGLTATYKKQVSEVDSCIGSAACADASDLVARLGEIKPADANLISEKKRDQIKGIFFASRAKFWAPERELFDYAGASGVVDLAFELYGEDSAWVRDFQEGLDASRNAELSRLNDEFNREIQQDHFADHTDHAEGLRAVLDAVRQIDETHPLLSDGRIKLAFQDGVTRSFAASNIASHERIALARKRIALAEQHLQEDTETLEAMRSELAQFEQDVAAITAEERLAEQQAAQLEDQLRAVQELLDNPVLEDQSWRAELRENWLAVVGNPESEGADRDALAQKLQSFMLSQSQQRREQADLESAVELARLSVELLPEDQELAKLYDDLTDERDQKIQAAATEAERTRLTLQKLDQLLDKASATTAWVTEVDQSVGLLRGKIDAADLAARIDRFVSALESSVSGALDKGDIRRAQTLVDSAQKSSVKDERLGALANTVADRVQKIESAELAKLGGLIDKAEFGRDWQSKVDASLALLAQSRSAETASIKQRLGQAYAKRANALAKEKKYSESRRLIDAGVKRAGKKSAALIESRALVKRLEREEKLAREAEQKQFKVKELERTISIKAAAGELQVAIAALNELKALEPKNAYANSEAPKQISAGAIRLADRFASRKDYSRAVKAVDLGLSVIKARELVEARARYDVQICIQSLDREVAKAGTLDKAELKACLAMVRARAPSSAGRYEKLDQPPPPPPPPKPKPVPKPEVKPVPPPPPPPPPARPQTPQFKPGSDPCRGKDAGEGVRARGQCIDKMASGADGPTLVKIGGDGTYLITQMETAVLHWAMYCADTGKCPAPRQDPLLPITNVSIEQALDYAKWMSHVTGRNYSIPSQRQWKHAASQGGRDILVQGLCKGSSGNHGKPRRVNAGPPAKWGLVNTVGNVWEIVHAGGQYIAVGGSYESKGKNCNLDSKRGVSGPDPSVGFRLVRQVE